MTQETNPVKNLSNSPLNPSFCALRSSTATGLSRRQFLPAALLTALALASWPARTFAAGGPIKVRLGTLAPKGSSYYKHLQAMGEKWRTVPGGVALTIYPDGSMGGEADVVRRMRLGQLQAGLLTATGLGQIEPAATGLQFLPMMLRTLNELDYISQQLQPLVQRRLEEKGFVALFWTDTGWLRFFSKQPVIRPADLRKVKLFVWAGDGADLEIYRSVGCSPVPLETADILPSLQTGLINGVPLPPSYALAGQVDSAAPHMLDLAWAPLVGALVITKKTWDSIPAEARESLRKAASETGNLIKSDGRRESVESVEAMQKRGLTVHTLTPEIEAEWRVEAAKLYPKIRGGMVPSDIFDEVVKQLGTYRAAREGNKK
jgi:TRAP-type transport system periplasmic protein